MDAKVVLRSGYRVHALDARNFLNSMAQMLKHLLMLACTSMIAIGQVVAADASSAGGTAEKPALFMNL